MIKLRLLTLSSCLLLLACGQLNLETLVPDNRPDYKQSRTVNPLELPPDLTSSSVDDTLIVPELSGVDKAQLSGYQAAGDPNQSRQTDHLASTLKNIQRAGNTSWISIADSPTQVFNHIRSFWHANGLPLARTDANIGIIETAWLEKRSTLPKGGLMGLFAGVLGGLHDSGVRDKFRSRVDFDGKNTLVYMTHYGATEEQVDEAGKVIKHEKTNADDAQFAFVASSRNPELEVEMLRRLNLYLIKNHKQSAQSPTALPERKSTVTLSRLSDDTPALIFDSDFEQAWIMLGIAIDRAGYELSEQDRRNGFYSFDKVTESKSGFIFTQTEKSFESFQLAVADQGNQQIAIVRLHQQSPQVDNKVAQEVLHKLAEEISL